MIKRKRSVQFNRASLWVVNHVRAALQGLGEFVRTPLASIATVVVIGIAIALPVCLYLILENFQDLSQNWHGNPSISLYLQKNTPESRIQAISHELSETPHIQAVQYISPQQGLSEFNHITQFHDVLNTLKENPLPPVIVVTPTPAKASFDALQTLLTRLKMMPDVDIAQLDMTWVKRLYSIVTLGRRLTQTLAALLGLGVLLIIGNTMRLTTQHHRQEITMLRLIGATNAFIRRPLLYRGVLYGLLGGCFAWLAVSLLLWSLANPAQVLAQSYHHTFTVHGLSLSTGVKILLLSAGLGWLGSWFAVQDHLKAQEEI